MGIRWELIRALRGVAESLPDIAMATIAQQVVG